MLVAALCYSAAFPVIELADAGRDRLAFTSAWYAGFSITTAALLSVRFPKLLGGQRVRSEIRQRIPSRDFWLGTCSDGAFLLLSLLWLTLLGGITVERPALLALGAALIVGANVAAKRRKGG